MLNELELQSGYARRFLLNMDMMTSAGEVEACYNTLRRFINFVDVPHHTHISTLLFRLKGVKDIGGTIDNLRKGAPLNDIELFEIKNLAILAHNVNELLMAHDMDKVIEVPQLDEVVSILDPDGMKIATFYVYDSYDPRLKKLRAMLKGDAPGKEEILVEASDIENEVRARLSRELKPHAAAIAAAQQALVLIDINMAKAMQVKKMNLCLPSLSGDNTCHYTSLFHPQVDEVLKQRGKNFQHIDIEFGKTPTLITGANMGGKTVVLKTLAMCQVLCQFGLGIPAQAATIDLKDEVIFCIGDEQSVETGLSSFAAEMKNIDRLISTARSGVKLLALVDEPARTTNPTEGTALVQALLQLLHGKTNVSLVMTTHYGIDAADNHCLRVKGLTGTTMDYSLIEVHNGEVPHEALNIARTLGIDHEWIATATALLNKASTQPEKN